MLGCGCFDCTCTVSQYHSALTLSTIHTLLFRSWLTIVELMCHICDHYGNKNVSFLDSSYQTNHTHKGNNFIELREGFNIHIKLHMFVPATVRLKLITYQTNSMNA